MPDFVTSDGGHVIALPARSVRYAVCEAMGSAVPEGFRPQPPTRPTGTAGTDVAEGVAVDGVAADPAVFDTDAAPSYRDRVKHDVQSVRLSPAIAAASNHAAAWTVASTDVAATWHGILSAEREAARRARLSRWQETRG